jgi:murein DD-endopeptidase MepM/ murein hydrolase activator NlpD
MSNKLWFIALSTLFSLSLSFPVLADPSFSFPVDCELETNCWIVKYVDVDTKIGSAKDYQCGDHTHDEHKGVDIGLKDLVEMENGVFVKAAETGTVLRIREDIDDFMPNDEDIKKIQRSNISCGNGVYIDHGEGWQTIYCHLKKDSVRVKPGEKVRRGEKIAKIGHSGLTEFPHLHFGVFYNGITIDPFTGAEDSKGCGIKEKSLWRSHKISKVYQAPAIMSAGFTTSLPNYQSIRIDSYSPSEIKKLSDALYFWFSYYGAQKNDFIKLEIFNPDGSLLVKHNQIQEKSRPRQFYYVGKKINPKTMKNGLYSGKVTITRISDNKKTIRDMSKSIYINLK